MKLVFRTIPQKPTIPPLKTPSVFFKNNTIKSLNTLETYLTFSGNMIDRVQSTGAPCGSCGGR